MGHREPSFHHWACPGFTQDECPLRHITNENLWPIYLHGGHHNRDGLSWHAAVVANPTARWWLQRLSVPTGWGTTPLSQCSLVLPEWTSASPLNWPCYCQWSGISHLGTQVTWPYPLWFFSLGVCKGCCVRATPSARSAQTAYCYCHRNHRHGRAVPCMARTWLSPGHMPRDTWN
jgi:hypothetical protein